MKKFLLSLFCLLMAFANIQAEEKTHTYEFKSANWSTSTGEVLTGSDNKLSDFYYKDGGKKFNANYTGYFSTNYFLWGKTGAYIELPTFTGEEITEIIATASSTCSEKVTIGVFDNNNNKVVEAVTWKKSTEFPYNIPENYRSATLRLQITNDNNAQIAKLVIKTKTIDNSGETPEQPEEPETPNTQEVIDILDRTFIGVTGTTYSDWSGKTATSKAVYAGKSAGGNSSIQLNSTNPSGIVTTASGGKVKKVVVEWNSEKTNAARILQLYGKDEAYSSAADLYDTDKQGTLIKVLKTTETTIEIEGDYKYIGLRSKDGAMYLTSITITWDASNVVEAVAQPVITPDVTEHTVGDEIEVEITTATDGATIYYTLDGTDPTTDSNKYNEAFTISATTTVKAFAVKDGCTNSAIATKTFTFKNLITLENASVADVIEAYKPEENKIAEGATVIGYIVGTVVGTTINNSSFTIPTETQSNILIADNADETDIKKCITVELEKDTEVRTALNLADNPGNYKKRVILTGNVEEYFKVAGLKSTSAYGFIVEPKVNAEWATYYAPIDIAIPEGMEAYIATGVNNGSVTLKQIAGTIPANTGVLLKQSGNTNTSATTDDVSENLLQGSATNIYVTEEAYVLSMIDGVIGFYKAAMNQQDGTAWLNNANKAYLPASAISEASGISFYGFRFDDEDDETTAVENVEFRNEKEECFDLAGRRISEITAPGIYIIGGRKVLIK